MVGVTWERRKPLRRVTPISAAPSARRRRPRGSPDDPAPAGSPVHPRRRENVYVRDDHACVRCGLGLGPGYRQLQHRVARGSGGRIGHDAYSHLILLCGFSSTDPDGCHHWVETWRIEAQAAGWLVPDGTDPTTWPVRYSMTHGGGLWTLDDLGDRVRVG
jgi:hypothetical protein